MTKQEEIATLKDAVTILTGSPSYTGQWFADQLPAMIAAIQADMQPETRVFTLGEYIAHGAEIIANAEKAAAGIIKQAKDEAERAREIAAKLSYRVREIERAIEAIRRM